MTFLLIAQNIDVFLIMAVFGPGLLLTASVFGAVMTLVLVAFTNRHVVVCVCYVWSMPTCLVWQ